MKIVILVIKKLQKGFMSKGWKNPGAMAGAGVPAKGFGKKRGRKEDLRSRKEAAHGFRNLSVIKILLGFEQAITEMKIKNDEIMNNGGHTPSPFGAQLPRLPLEGKLAKIFDF